MYHNEKHFTDSFNFHPEKFMGDERFVNDDREAMQPFRVGPRNCKGKKSVIIPILLLSNALCKVGLKNRSR